MVEKCTSRKGPKKIQVDISCEKFLVIQEDNWIWLEVFHYSIPEIHLLKEVIKVQSSWKFGFVNFWREKFNFLITYPIFI